MAASKQDSTPPDPFEVSRQIRDTYLEGLSKVMRDAVNSEEYAKTTGSLLNSCLDMTAPFRGALEKSMLVALEQYSLPSRQQVTALAERFTNLETRLDDLDAKLDRLVELASGLRTQAPQPFPTGKPTPIHAMPSHKSHNKKS